MNANKNPLISVIIPVYNTGEYLEDCLNSIINQTLTDIEIICINDGSTDNSIDILKRYAYNDSRLRLINNKSNLGASISRNKGLEFAIGEYIVFHDSDDFIDYDAYEKLYNFAKQNANLDFVIFDVKRFNDEGIIWNSILHKQAIGDERIHQTNFLEHPELVFDTSVANKFIKKDFITRNNFKFIENTLYEDLLLSMKFLCTSECFGICPDVKYYWRVRENENKSITQYAFSTKNLKDRITITKHIFNLFNSQEKFKVLLNPFYTKLIKIDILQFLNELDRCDDEFREIMIRQVLPFVEKIPKNLFDSLDDIDKLKYKLFIKKQLDDVAVLAQQRHEIRKLKINNRKQHKIMKDTIRIKNELIREKKSLNYEIRTIKSTKGWFTYKIKNIYERIFKKI